MGRNSSSERPWFRSLDKRSIRLKMNLSAVLFVAASAQDDGSDRWTYADYAVDNVANYASGKAGAATSGVYGYGSGNGRFCHSTKDTVHIHRWDLSKNGYFAHYNQVECVGEELYCFVEERAHFGQIIGIRAGCAQMMNHPQVDRNDAAKTNFDGLPYVQPVYNQEAARGQTFEQNSHGTINIYYGIGGCLAHPAQNGNDQLHQDFLNSMSQNHYNYRHGGWYQSQCLRTNGPNGNAELLPFGVSVCRACCMATYSEDMYVANTARVADTANTAGTNRGVCNFLPYPKTAGGVDIPDQTKFDCFKGTQGAPTACGMTNASEADDCDFCTKQLAPALTMYEVPAYLSSFSQNLFESTFVRPDTDAAGPCNAGVCTPTAVISQPMA